MRVREALGTHTTLLLISRPLPRPPELGLGLVSPGAKEVLSSENPKSLLMTSG